MDSSLKQRLIGAAVLALVAVAVVPPLLNGPDVKEPDAAEVPLKVPAEPDGGFETRELTLAAPQENTPPGGVLGMAPAPTPPAPDAAPVQPVDGTDVTPTPAPTAAPAMPAASPVAASPVPAAPVATATPASLPVAPTPKPVAPTPTPAPPPAAAPVPAAAVAAGNFALNVGTFTNADNANALVARLRAAKLPVTSEAVKLNGGSAVRVRVGPYVDRAAAEAARLRADSIAGSSTKVIALDGRALAPATTAAAMPTTLPRPAPATPPAPKPVAPTPAPTAPAPTASGFSQSAAASGFSQPAAASGFAVQLAAPAEEQAALGLRDRAKAAGFVAFVQRVDTADGPRFRVRLGPTADRAAADAMRASAAQKLGINGNVVSHP